MTISGKTKEEEMEEKIAREMNEMFNIAIDEDENLHLSEYDD